MVLLRLKLLGIPENLKTTVEPFVKAIYQEIDTTPKPFSGIREAHVGDMESTHLCSKACLNIPTQTCANVCGVAVAVHSAIVCTVPELLVKCISKTWY